MGRFRKRFLVFPIIAFILNILASELFAKKWPVYARHGMVVSSERIASEIGVEILKKGGNAVDAAVAVGFAMAVVHPAAGNIGGGGFMVIRFADGTSTAIDYRAKAPLAAHEKMYLNRNGELIENLNDDKYLLIAVPGTVAGLSLALKKYGTRSLKEVIKPAIKLAEKGFPVSYVFARELHGLSETFKKYPASAKKFLRNSQEPYKHSDVFKQRDLAKTLKRIARHGSDGFYKGETAELIAHDLRENGGLITKKDLAEYQAVIRQPITTRYRGYDIIGMPPPSSGGITLAIMLNILAGYNLAELGHNSAAYIHVFAEAMRRAFADRALYLGDPDFNRDLPVNWLISREHADELRKSIQMDHASKSSPDRFTWASESSETTHFSVVDAKGNAVSNTYTIESWYGSKIVANGAGFLYTDIMTDFNVWPGHTDSTGLIGTEPNLIRPGKRMLSSMTPTIISKEGKTFMVTGGPGSRTIITTVLQSIVNAIDFEMNIFDAIDAPKFHHQWLPDILRMEKFGISNDTEKLLREKGHRIKRINTLGRLMGIIIDPESGYRMGAGDPRSPNRGAVGY